MSEKDRNILTTAERNLKENLKNTKKLHQIKSRDARIGKTQTDARNLMAGEKFGQSDRDQSISTCRSKAVMEMRGAFGNHIIRRKANSLVMGQPGHFIHGLAPCHRHKYNLTLRPDELEVFEGVIDRVQSAM